MVPKPASSWIAFWCAGLLATPCVGTAADQSAPVKTDAAEHPLTPAIRYATACSAHIREHVRDYSCRIIKRERMEGELQSRQFANMRVRCERPRNDGSVEPLAVYMHFVAPGKIKNRKILYVADQNDGKMVIRKGGRLMKHVKLRVDPFSDSARSESKYAIMDAGLDKLMDRFVQRAKADRERDPTAANTRVSHFVNAMINKRPCTHFQIVHPEPTDGMEFHRLSLYVDNELRVPTRLIVHGWPEREGDKPPVIEEFTYIDLRLNLGLTDSDFSESLLANPRQAKAATAGQRKR